MKLDQGKHEIDWLPGAVQARNRRFDKLTGLLLLILVAAAIGVGFIRVDQVVTATGQIVPSAKVKTIQHLEGGIVKSMNVREGEVVAADQALVELDLATAGLNLSEIQTRNAALTFTRDRLLAESQSRPLRPAPDLAKNYPDLARIELATYEARMREHTGTLAVFDSQAAQQRSRVSEWQVKLENARIRLKTAEQEFQIANDLFRERLISQFEFIDRRKALESARAELATLSESIEGVKAAVAESLAKRNEEEGRFRRKSADELSLVERQLSSARDELSRASDQRGRAVIRSPIAGIVKNLKLQAVGNVVRQGEPIMEIVPVDEAIVVEARLSPADRGYLSIDLPTTVKVSAYDFLRYGALQGKITQIAADTSREGNEAPYFKVIVSTTRSYLGSENKPLWVSPGMQAEVDIHVGSQSFVWYLIKPVLKLRQEAFREP